MTGLTIDHIRDPLWTRPTVVDAGQGVPIHLDLPITSCDALTVTLSSRWRSVTCRVDELRPDDTTDLMRIEAVTPAALVPDTYDLTVAWDGGRDRMPNAVVIPDPDATSLRVAHIADPHVSAAMVDQPGAALAGVIEQLLLLAPDVVLLTGDLVYRYGPDKEVLSADTIDRDMWRAQRLLKRLDAPLWLTAGNHDLSYPWLRRRYRERFVRPLADQFDAYSFQLGDVSFHTVEAYRFYEDEPPVTEPIGPNDDQVDAFQAGIADSSADYRVAFYHYDYRDALTEVFEGDELDLALCGHTSPMRAEWSGTTLMIRNLPVFEEGHIQLFEIANGELLRRPWWRSADYPDDIPIGVEFERANDGTERRNHARVRNRTPHGFTNCRVRFLLVAGRYTVTGGRLIEEEMTGSGVTTCEVAVDLPAESTREIVVAPPGQGQRPR